MLRVFYRINCYNTYIRRKDFSIAIDIQGKEITEATTNIEVAIRKNSQRQKKLPDHLSDFVVDINQFYVLSCFVMGDTSEYELKLYKEAKGISEWKNAMMEEISALEKMTLGSLYQSFVMSI